MKKIIILVLLNLLLCSIATAQHFAWAKSMGGAGRDEGFTIVLDDLGNVYTVGQFSDTADFDPDTSVVNLVSAGAKDIFIQKLDTAGNFIWAKRIGGVEGDAAFAMAIDDSNHIHITGFFSDTVDFDPGTGVHTLIADSTDIFVLKLDDMGNFMWAKGMSGGPLALGIAYAIAVDDSGNVYTTGEFWDTVDFDPDTSTYNLVASNRTNIFIQKLDADGKLVWAKNMGGIYGAGGLAIVVDHQGAIRLTGRFAGTVDFDPGLAVFNLVGSRPYSIFVEKLDTYGNFVWAKVMSGGRWSQGNGITLDDWGNLYMTGGFSGTVNLGLGHSSISTPGAGPFATDAYVLKLDDRGDFLWATTMGSTETDEGYAIETDRFGNVYTVGVYGGLVDFDPGPATFSLHPGRSSWMFVQKLDSMGNFIWAKGVGARGKDIVVNDSGHVYVTGFFGGTQDFDPSTAGVSTLSSAGNEDVFIQKLEPCSSSSTSTDTIMACSVVSYTWIDGVQYRANNYTATHRLQTSLGCDSIITLNLTFGNSTNFNIDTVSACAPYTWIDGRAYSSNTTRPQHRLTNVAGCDSIVILHLTILPTSTGIDTVISCDAYTWMDGNTYRTNNNTARHTLSEANVWGCDSTVTLNLTIEHPVGTATIAGCDSFTWIDGLTYVVDNNIATHTIVGGSVRGCDSIVLLDLTLTSVDSGLIVTRPSIMASATGAFYRWLDCNNNYAVIPNEVARSFVASTNGSYAVEITKFDCIDTSRCVTISSLSILENSLFKGVSIFPNPSTGLVNIDLANLREASMKAFDLNGKLIYQKENIKAPSYQFELKAAAGVYFIEISSQRERQQYKLIKK